MVSSVSAGGASGIAAAVPVAQSSPAALASTARKPAASGEDTVKISATAQEVQQPTSAQVRLLHAEGQSVPQIASKLQITPQAVQSYLGTPAQAEIEIAAIVRFDPGRLSAHGHTYRVSLQSG